MKLLFLSVFILLSINLYSQTDSVVIFKNTIPDNGDLGSSPYFFVKSMSPSEDKFPLIATYVDVNIAGVIAEVVVKQIYVNDGKNTLEAVYIFPGSAQSAVYAMTMQIGKQILVAKIKEKEEAKKDYEKAKSEGKTATLLEQNKPNVFQMSVANILPKDSIIVELKYTELLTSTNGVYEFRYPQVVAPRYSETSEEWQKIAESQLKEGTGNYFVDFAYDVKFDLNININAGMPISDISSSSHKIITKINKNESTVKLDNSEKKVTMKDFVLDYSLRGNEVKSGLLVYETKDENYFTLLVQPPKKAENSQIPPREYVFIVDVSGSMQGYPISVSKTILDTLIGSLRQDDIFNVMVFSYGNSILAPTSLNANSENIEKAKTFLNASYQYGGSTQLLEAMTNALNMKPNQNYSRTFVIITDGEVTCESEAFKLIRDNLHEANLFAIGIGTTINDYIINGLAYSGMGEPFLIESQAKATEVGKKFIEMVENPVFTNIELKYQGLEVYDVEPKAIPDVFSDRPIVIYGKYKNNNSGTITVNGLSGNTNIEQKFNIADAKSDNNTALKYIWARNRIKYLDDYEVYYNELTAEQRKKETTELGLKYGLLTKYTSFIAVDSLARTQANCIDDPKSGLNNGIVEKEEEQQLLNAKSAHGIYYKYTEKIELATSDDFADASNATADIVVEVEEEASPVVEQVFESFQIEEQPSYPGGDVELKNFIATNLIYPELAKENDIQGTVYIRFQITRTGEIGEVLVLRSVDPLLDAEAIRLVKSLPKWAPGHQNGNAVNVWFVIPIKFVLE